MSWCWFRNVLVSECLDFEFLGVLKGVGFETPIQVGKGKTILQAALDQNMEIPYSCRSGMCSSCKAKCISGQVKMLDGHLLPEAEVNDGYVLTCISFPSSEEVELVLPQ